MNQPVFISYLDSFHCSANFTLSFLTCTVLRGFFPFKASTRIYLKRLKPLPAQRKLSSLARLRIYLLVPSAQGGEETTQRANALKLNDEQQNDEDSTLHREGHEKAPNARL